MKNLSYLLKEGFRSLWANRLMSVASIGVLVSCLLLIGGSYLVLLNVNTMVGYVEEQNEIVAFLEDDLTEEQLNEIDIRVYMTDNISAIEFVSKEDALEQEKELLGEYSSLLDLENNPFPASYRLKIKDLSYLNETVSNLEKIDGIEQISASVDVADAMTSIKRVIGICSFGIVAILLIVSLMIISNTIKVTVFNRRKEINIMKYVGATNSFIRLPFVVEGILLGLISATLSYLIIWGGYHYLSIWLQDNPVLWLSTFHGLVPFEKISTRLMIFFGGFGILIGAVGSSVFVRKYLKV